MKEESLLQFGWNGGGGGRHRYGLRSGLGELFRDASCLTSFSHSGERHCPEGATIET